MLSVASIPPKSSGAIPPPIRIPHAFLPPLPSVMPTTFSFPAPLLSTLPFPILARSPCPVESGHVDTTSEK